VHNSKNAGYMAERAGRLLILFHFILIRRINSGKDKSYRGRERKHGSDGKSAKRNKAYRATQLNKNKFLLSQQLKPNVS